jgi:N-acyl homoserine lactone hydrolase
VDAIEVRPVSTGRVRVHEDMYRGRGPGMVRRARILRRGPMGEARPIHAWVVMHPEGVLLVDTGEVASVRDTTFARFEVARRDELDEALKGVDVDPADVERVVLTHVHGDHVDGLAHVPRAQVLVHDREITVVNSVEARLSRRIVRQPLPEGFAPTPFALDGGSVGAFATSHALTEDGRVLVVPLPGHTPGHVGVLIEQGDHHVLIGGDSSYDVAQLRDLAIDGVSPSAKVAAATMRTILEHAALHPTVYLPSHDPESAQRLQHRVTL